MANLKLWYPLSRWQITQRFGENLVPIYKQMGMKGHNGLDFKIIGHPRVFAAHDGFVVWSGVDQYGGVSVEIVSHKEDEGYKTIYYHLKETFTKKNRFVKAGQAIGRADNTGIFSFNKDSCNKTYLYKALRRIKDEIIEIRIRLFLAKTLPIMIQFF